jgi:hypothetical protein
MKVKRLLLLAAGILAFVSGCDLFGPTDLGEGAPAGVLVGTLYDTVSGHAIERGRVSASFGDATITVESGEGGAFQIAVRAGSVPITFSAPGYTEYTETMTVVAGTTDLGSKPLRRSATNLSMTRFDVIEFAQTSYNASGDDYISRRIRSEFNGSFSDAVGGEIEYADGGLAQYSGPVQVSSMNEYFSFYTSYGSASRYYYESSLGDNRVRLYDEDTGYAEMTDTISTSAGTFSSVPTYAWASTVAASSSMPLSWTLTAADAECILVVVYNYNVDIALLTVLPPQATSYTIPANTMLAAESYYYVALYALDVQIVEGDLATMHVSSTSPDYFLFDLAEEGGYDFDSAAYTYYYLYTN